jgi:hypothetical protein
MGRLQWGFGRDAPLPLPLHPGQCYNHVRTHWSFSATRPTYRGKDEEKDEQKPDEPAHTTGPK